MTFRLVPFPPFRRSRALALAGLALLACAAVAPAKQKWLKVEAPEFTIYSDASEKQIAECAVQYAAFRRTLTQLFVPPDHTLPPSVLILFRSASAFHELIPDRSKDKNTTQTNFSVEVDGTPFSTFAIAGDLRGALSSTFEFETIWALRRLGYFVPVWMSQGAGEVLSELQVRKGKCLVGEQSNHSSGSSYDWTRFFEIGETSKAYSDPSQLADFLSQAWGLMHWILLKDDATRERFADLAGRLRNTSALDAVAAVMATPPDQFERAIDRHLSHSRKPREIDFDEAAVRSSLHFTPALEAEILAQTSDLLASSDQVVRANAQLDRARVLAPDLAVVKDAWARRLLREGREDEALEFYRAAIDAGTRNFAAYVISATFRLNDVSSYGRDVAGEGGPQANIAADELRQALKLNPGSSLAYRQLGRAFFVMPKVTDENVAELSPGVVPGADGAVVRLYRALVYGRLQQPANCRADLQAIVDDPGASDSIREQATHRLDQM